MRSGGPNDSSEAVTSIYVIRSGIFIFPDYIGWGVWLDIQRNIRCSNILHYRDLGIYPVIQIIGKMVGGAGSCWRASHYGSLGISNSYALFPGIYERRSMRSSFNVGRILFLVFCFWSRNSCEERRRWRPNGNFHRVRFRARGGLSDF